MKLTRIIGPALAVATLIVAGVVAGAPSATAATPTVNQVHLDPSSTVDGVQASATLTVTSSACFTAQALTVAVRDSAGNAYDFPGAVTNVQICPAGYTFTTNTRSFTAGTYTVFGAFEFGNVWTNISGKSSSSATSTCPVASANGNFCSLNVGPAGTTARPSWKTSGTYTLAAGGSDEFNGSSLDTSKWQTGWFPPPSGTNTVPVNVGGDYPEQACYSPNNVKIISPSSGVGYLQLLLTHTTSSCTVNKNESDPNCTNTGTNAATCTEPWTGAMINSRNSFVQKGGSFEARVNIPPSAASDAQAGGFPAWWLTGRDTDAAGNQTLAPAHGEIDVVEGLDGDGKTQAHTHYDSGGGTSGGTDGGQNSPLTSKDAYVGWHNFGASWTAGSAGSVTFYWDGKQLGPSSLPMPSANPEYLLFDNSITGGSAAPKGNSSALLVDWVRTWTTT